MTPHARCRSEKYVEARERLWPSRSYLFGKVSAG